MQRLQPGDHASLEWRGLAYLKLRKFDAAISDYDAALKRDPRSAPSLFGRGVAKWMAGDQAAGAADIAAAEKIDPHITDKFEGYGVRGF